MRLIAIREQISGTPITQYDYYSSTSNADMRLIPVVKRISIIVADAVNQHFVGLRIRQNSGGTATANINLMVTVTKQ